MLIAFHPIALILFVLLLVITNPEGFENPRGFIKSIFIVGTACPVKSYLLLSAVFSPMKLCFFG